LICVYWFFYRNRCKLYPVYISGLPLEFVMDAFKGGGEGGGGGVSQLQLLTRRSRDFIYMKDRLGTDIGLVLHIHTRCISETGS
jgi:hypothetical protein